MIGQPGLTNYPMSEEANMNSLPIRFKKPFCPYFSQAIRA